MAAEAETIEERIADLQPAADFAVRTARATH
jgi:hypothetical protein